MDQISDDVDRAQWTPIREAVKVFGEMKGLLEKWGFDEAVFFDEVFTPLYADKAGGADLLAAAAELLDLETTPEACAARSAERAQDPAWAGRKDLGEPRNEEQKNALVHLQILMAICAFCVQALKAKDGSAEAWTYMLDAAKWRGILSGRLMMNGERESSRKEMLAKFGQKGAEARNKGFNEIKAWALEKSASMRDSDMSIARKLSAQLPAYLADKSKDPARLIYETLRNRSPD